MKRLAIALLLTGCATVAPKTHHTAPISAPSAVPVTSEIKKAQDANQRAQKASSRQELKAITVLKWLRSQ